MNIDLSRYEPRTVSDIIFGNRNSQQTIDQIVSGRQSFPAFGKQALLLHGVWGTGTSTLARMLPGAIELGKTGSACNGLVDIHKCKQGDNGAKLMEKISQATSLVSFNDSGLQYVVLDEVDLLTKNAQASLKGLLDRSSLAAILTTNYIDQIDKGIIDRSHLIEMNAAKPEQWLPLCRRILTDIGINNVSDAQLLPYIARQKGSARNIAN
jgi:DNA polymerase III delta prime subunit